MKFELISKKESMPPRHLEFASFWDFFDRKNSYISGVDKVIWNDRGYNYDYDLNQNKVFFNKIGESKKYLWTEYEAFKMPVDLVEDEDFDF